ncbi:glycoside hydrolase family 78 protein [Halosquirtibacter xylanolyticus]|uniref:family 78 glycoside hydrolase catalytic domain n=1 Tax=Halosquirtibacter xylanolyticus TaxID=3374599 RepID=UPI003747EEBE|nr:glycoside hydrolase family 78 protein [Prolixibacteraceae bacterium]
MIKPIILFALFLMFYCKTYAQPQKAISHLECEYLTKPHGLDTTNPHFSWQLNPQSITQQKSYRIMVASNHDLLNDNTPDLWDSGIINDDASTNITYTGKQLKSFQSCFWKVLVWDNKRKKPFESDVSTFDLGPLSSQKWKAKWIGANKSIPKNNFPIFSKIVEIHEDFDRAIIDVNCLGYFELYINGKKTSKDILTPSVSDYSKHSLYLTYNIKPYLQLGKNTITLWCAHGWYRNKSKSYGVDHLIPLIRAQIRLSYKNRHQTIGTDTSWYCKASNRSYIGGWKWNNYGGEKVNLNKMTDLNSHKLTKNKGWIKASYYNVSSKPAINQRNNPTYLQDTITPQNIKIINDNELLVDFGRHLTGWIKLNLPKEQCDSIIHIEYIDRILDIKSITSVRNSRMIKAFNNTEWKKGYQSFSQIDQVISSPQKNGTFQNKFNYRGFRWVKISGLHKLDKKKIQAFSLYENNKKMSEFTCSNPLLNKIWDAVVNTYRALNYSGYVVDCPHRERFGYGGDSHSSLETGMSIFDLAALSNKWAIDWNQGINDNGMWPHTIPESNIHKNKFSPGWGGFGLFLPWNAYRYYGNFTTLKASYPQMKRWMSYMKSKCINNILCQDSTLSKKERLWSFHGDWVAPHYGMSPKHRVDSLSTAFFNNCFYLYDLKLISKIASTLGYEQDAKKYNEMYQISRKAVHKKFYSSERGCYVNGEQPYQAFPLLVGVVPANLTDKIDNYLENLILVKNKGHLNSGMLGTYFLLEYLMQSDRNDLIYTMVNQKTFPGWGYMIENGATTIWEQWNGNNSQMHNCYLSIGKWFIQGIGGIQLKDNTYGFSHFVIKPCIITGLDHAKVTYDTRYGTISSQWNKSQNLFTHKITIPTNTKADYTLPKNFHGTVKVNGKNYKTLTDKDKNSFITLPTGTYEIELGLKTKFPIAK